MMYSILWSYVANNSYFEELDFIYKKWNQKQLILFEELVEFELQRLKNNPLIGVFDNKFKLYYLVISKQTTLYYRINIPNKNIELALFWNNSKNPNDLKKLL